MLNVVCVKIGTKYQSYLVNQLYEMCKANITESFKFFCYTDNPAGLNNNVTVIPYTNQNLFPIVYNKLFLLNNEHFCFEDRCLYFDLDIVIKSNIDSLTTPTNNLSVIHAGWKTPQHLQKRKFYKYYHTINSSCMTWRPGTVDWIWDMFSRRKYPFMNKYHMGADNFLFYEVAPYNLLNKDLFCSFTYGHDFRMEPDEKRPDYRFTTHPVVLFNGPEATPFFDSFYDYFYPSISATMSSHIP